MRKVLDLEIERSVGPQVEQFQQTAEAGMLEPLHQSF